MRERVWGSPDVGRAPGCVRTQGTLPGSIWKRGMWRGVATQVSTHRTHGTQEMRRLRQDATPTDQTQGAFLLMHYPPAYYVTTTAAGYDGPNAFIEAGKAKAKRGSPWTFPEIWVQG